MADARSFRVFDDQGYIGDLMAPARFLDGRSQKTIRLRDGREITVNANDLKIRDDGSFQLVSAPAPAAEPVVVQPAPPVSAHAAQNGVSPEFFESDYQIERVQIGQIVESAPEQRQDGDTLVLPVVEEVLVCEKKLLLKEEIRIARRRKPVQEVRKIQNPPRAG